MITLKPNAVVRNLVIHYPEQALSEVVPHPWIIRADGEHCQILDLTINNPYQAIDVGTKWNRLPLIRNLFACPLKTGIDIDQCIDIGWIVRTCVSIRTFRRGWPSSPPSQAETSRRIWKKPGRL